MHFSSCLFSLLNVSWLALLWAYDQQDRLPGDSIHTDKLDAMAIQGRLFTDITIVQIGQNGRMKITGHRHLDFKQ